MCGRTSLFADPGLLEERFDATIEFDYRARYNVAPRQPLATIRNTDADVIVEQEWGLLAPRADGVDDGPRPINARSETVAEMSTFREAFVERRCLVLADGFYEWKGERGSKQPYRVYLEDDDPFAMAGIWNRWEHDGDGLETVAILTTEPNEVVASIHDRMPVVFAPEEEGEWLSADVDRAQELCDPYAGEDMVAYAVSRIVDDPANDRPDVLDAADSEQREIGEFGS